MTTYYDITKTVERLQRRPKKTSTNASMEHGIFGDQSQKMLPIREFIDDYNYHMGGVDIADQLRPYYCTQQHSCRNWYPLFYWLLDTTLVNAYRIQKTLHSPWSIQSEHYMFRTRVADQLIHNGLKLHNLKTEPPSTAPVSSPPTVATTYIGTFAKGVTLENTQLQDHLNSPARLASQLEREIRFDSCSL